MTRSRHVGFAAGALLLGVLIAVPVLGASPSPSGAPAASPKPSKEPKGQSDKAKGPEVAATVTGTVTQGTDADGHPTFTITTGGKTWTLEAGPSWYWGDKNPLAASVGKSVTVVGSHHADSLELDVETVDGKAIRAPGKPPWAGGPWVVGPTHPGWKEWMADGKPGNGHGRANAPGQSKKESAAP